MLFFPNRCLHSLYELCVSQQRREQCSPLHSNPLLAGAFDAYDFVLEGQPLLDSAKIQLRTAGKPALFFLNRQEPSTLGDLGSN